MKISKEHVDAPTLATASLLNNKEGPGSISPWLFAIFVYNNNG